MVPLLVNIALRRTDLADIEWLAEDSKFLRGAVGYEKLPRQRALAGHLKRYGPKAKKALKTITAQAVAQADIHPEPAVEPDCPEFYPLDIDSSIFEQFAPKREGVETTYNGKLCYSPVFAFFGLERFCIHHRLAPGREKAVERIDEFVDETIAFVPEKIARNQVLARLDSGFYSRKTVESCQKAGIHYIVKARLSTVLEERTSAELESERFGVELRQWGGEFYGEFEYEPQGWKNPRRFVFCTQVKTHEDNGQRLLFPRARHQVLVTSLDRSIAPEAVFRLYRRRGAVEEPIKEIKHDLDLEQLPSQHFGSNEVVLAVGIMAYNLLVMLGQMQAGAPGKTCESEHGESGVALRRRIKTLQDRLLRVAAAVADHARKRFLRVPEWWLERVNPAWVLRNMERLRPIGA
jgi:hypothetical protein